MDIRKWFTSPKTAAKPKDTSNSKNNKDTGTEKTSKASKRQRLVLDSDSDDESKTPKKRHSSPKKLLKSDSNRKSVSPNKRKSTKVSNDDNITSDDFDSPSSKKSKIVKEPLLRPNRNVTKVEKSLHIASVADFFGNTPIERSLKKTPKKSSKEISSNLELNHEDDDFSKTLLQLETTEVTPKKRNQEKRTNNSEIKTTPEKTEIKIKETTRIPQKETTIKKIVENNKKEKIDRKRHPSSDIEIDPSPNFSLDVSKKGSPKVIKKESKIKDSSKKKLKSKSLSSDIEFEPSPKVIEKKKEVIKVSPPTKEKSKKGGNSANYMSYLHRDGPRALGSKEIPEGEEDCLSGKTFILTGVLESVTREEVKDLIESHGGKMMTTLSKNTMYAIIGRDAGPSKLEKVEKLGTKQLTEDSLFELIKNTPGKGPKKVKRKTLEKAEDDEIFGDDDDSFFCEIPDEDEKPQKNCTSTEKQSSEKTTVSPIVAKENKTDAIKTSVIKAVDKTPTVEMWVDKYKPISLKQLIGQQDGNSNAKKLMKWLENWCQNTKNKKPAVAGRWNSSDNGAGFKAALLSGPPGVGKTTTAQLVCKETGFDFVELNASDTRSKKSLQSMASELLQNQSLANCFKSHSKKGPSRNHVIIMDEVDGMAGNEDRGGIQELISFIKATKIPIICICNDRNHPKMRSLANYCFDLRFQRPRVEQIKGAMMSIAFKEGIKVTPAVLTDVITASNQDIRQVLHNLSMWCAKEKGLSAEQAKIDIGQGTKHIKMGPFDVLREVFTVGQNSKSTFNDKANLFFHDYSIAPLFVQENYVHVSPLAAGGDKIKHMHLLSECADSICVGDIIEKQIRSQGRWNLLPIEAIFASVIPGDLMAGHLKQMINFPAWLGKNSNRKHMDRMLQELQMHMRMRITGNKTEVSMDYLPLLRNALTNPLLLKENEGIPDVLKVMEHYCLLREDFDSVIELSLWSNQTDPRTKISAKVKSAFTRTYNKECTKNPYAVSAVSKKKKSSTKDTDLGLLGEEENIEASEDEEENDKLENDAMIKVKKTTKATASSSKGNSTAASKKGTKQQTSRKNRNK